MWERIVLNLVSNAFKFTFEGEIRVALRRDGADAVLSVADTGTGIAADELREPVRALQARARRRARARTRAAASGSRSSQELARLHGGCVSRPRASSARARRSRSACRSRTRRRRPARRPRRAAPPPTSRRRCAGCPTRRRPSASWRPSAPALPAGDGAGAGARADPDRRRQRRPARLPRAAARPPLGRRDRARRPRRAGGGARRAGPT